MKVSIIGAGSVGATICYAALIKGVAREIVLVDIARDKAHAEALDLNHGMMFMPPATVRDGGISDCAGSDVVVITCGAKQKEGETRLDLAGRNVEIFHSLVPEILSAAPDAILLIVTNPVDVLTYAALKISGLPRSRVFGSGTVLDTSRFRFLLAAHCGVSVKNVHGYIIGEHGDSEVPLWSSVQMGSMRLADYCLTCRRHCDADEKKSIYESVRDAAYEIIAAKGATYYAIGLAAARILEAILRNERSILTVSTLLDGHFGIDDVCLSGPTVVDQNGAGETLPIQLDGVEMNALLKSADVVKAAIKSVGF